MLQGLIRMPIIRTMMMTNMISPKRTIMRRMKPTLQRARMIILSPSVPMVKNKKMG